ncbi:MAG: Uma2 family endonuclease [Deltaproteobacteria bacterium]|nr:Uma2 family endonuclease [Deltaproteobacteria bacterium]
MSTARALRYSEAEYLAMEETAVERHEFINGEILAMAGASLGHELAVGNLARALGNHLAGRPCRVFGSNLRLRVSETGLYTYPDVTVVCGAPEVAPTRPPSLLNPSLVVEILSDSTEAYDRGAKWHHYRRLASLRAYLLVNTAARRLELYTRNADESWTLTVVDEAGELAIPSLDVRLPLSEVYAGFEDLPREPEDGSEEPSP